MMRLIILFCWLFLPLIFFGTSLAATSLDMKEFSSLPVLEGGRIKPLDSLARSGLRFINRHEKIEDLSASGWLAEIWFNPEKARTRPVFEIDNPLTRMQLGLGEEVRKNFSFHEIAQGLEATKEQAESWAGENTVDLGREQKALVKIHEQARIFLGLSNHKNIFPLLGKRYGSSLRALEQAYDANDGPVWEKQVEIVKQDIFKVVGAPVSETRLGAELFYNILKPWLVAQALYVVALALMMVSFFKKQIWPEFLPPLIIAGAVFVQIVAICLRVFILARPPVGSLYESILFVSFVAPLAALVGWYFFRDRVLLVGGAIVALFLLCIAPAFAPASDSMEVLVAVLNTNFWLATHVICITLGYALCVFTACLAHVALFRRGAGVGNLQPRMVFEKRINLFLAASLFFTCFGTVLGGLWADQSWGRFWGWDPKENGALLIVLWIVWILHGRGSGHMGPGFYLTAVCGLNLVVAFSWIGVNLLGIGLHSYGFTGQALQGLLLFYAAEIVAIGALILRVRIFTRISNV
ncbi:MAG: cytochrome c biogenesis protein [Alphaproteobacteria bacterium]